MTETDALTAIKLILYQTSEMKRVRYHSVERVLTGVEYVIGPARIYLPVKDALLEDRDG